MKKLFLFSACVMLAFASCKKEAATTTVAANTITATVEGTPIIFATKQSAQLLIDSGLYELQVQGVNEGLSSAQSIIFGVVSKGPIVKGTYTLNSSTNPNATIIPIISYAASGTTDVFETDFNFANPVLSTTTTVSITSISGTNVQGTFNGVLVSTTSTAVIQTITNGKFNVDISANSSLSISRSSINMLSLKNRLRN